MPHLRSRDNHPPGGFKFTQPQTNWSAPAWQSFAATVSAVVSHRNGNPAITIQHALATDYDMVANEVDAYNAAVAKANGWTDFYAEDDAPVPFPSRPYSPVVVGVADHIKKSAIGIKAMADWLGDGLKPTDRITAENRAIVCAHCEFNQDPDWFQKLDQVGADIMRGLIEAKNKMELATTQDAKLNVCRLCDCTLRLKVWVEKEIAQRNTPPDIRAKLPAWCWIKKEAAFSS
jgi:hypothetical protein